MTTKYIDLPLFPDSYYTYTVALQGTSYTLVFTYNERCALYFVDLLTSDNVPIVVGEALVPNYPIFKDYAIFPLTGFFWLEEKATIISEPYKIYPDSIDQYYNFYYIYEDD